MIFIPPVVPATRTSVHGDRQKRPQCTDPIIQLPERVMFCSLQITMDLIQKLKYRNQQFPKWLIIFERDTLFLLFFFKERQKLGKQLFCTNGTLGTFRIKDDWNCLRHKSCTFWLLGNQHSRAIKNGFGNTF